MELLVVAAPVPAVAGAVGTEVAAVAAANWFYKVKYEPCKFYSAVYVYCAYVVRNITFYSLLDNVEAVYCIYCYANKRSYYAYYKSYCSY